jgi:hypothetical protein
VRTPRRSDATPRRVRLLLPAALLVTLAYPISLLGTAAAIAYALSYLAVLALGARVASVTRSRTVTAGSIATVLAVLMLPWTLRPDVRWLELTVFVLLIAFHVLVIAVVGEYLLAAPRIDVDVIFAGSSLYVLTGDAFIPAGLLVDGLTIEATGTSAYSAGPMTWSDMTYFSFTTLTTLGYGDVSPVTALAQALAIAEALLGVLIVALIIGRLVGAATAQGMRHRNDAGDRPAD